MSSDTHAAPANGASAAPGDAPVPFRWRWCAFAVILLATMMDILDSLVTTVAGPSIRADLGGSTTVIQWLTAGYTLAMASGLIIGGRLGDLFGRKRMFLVGVAGFVICSVLCGAAQDPAMLVGFRVVQGLFGAVMIPQGLGLIKELFPPAELPLAFGSIGPVVGLANISGPLVGGWLVDADFFGTGWRMIFLINLPLGLVCLIAGARLLPTAARTVSRLDLVGAATVAVAALLMVFPLVQGRELGWPAWTFASIAASVALFAFFGWYEARRQRSGGDPLVLPSLFRKRAFSGALVSGALMFCALIGFSLVFTLYLQLGLGYSPLRAALATLPQVIGSAVTALVAGRTGLAVRYGRRLIHLGVAAMAAGVGLLYLAVRLQGDHVHALWFAPALLLIGVGMGLAMSSLYFTVNTTAQPHESGSASGTFTAVQQLSGALGVAVIGTVFFGVLGGQVAARAADQAPHLRTQLAAAGISPAGQEQITAVLRDCERDRAVAEDAADLPPSCGRLRTALEGTPAAAAAVDRAGAQAAQRGFADSFERVLAVLAGLLALAFAVAFALPRARPSGTFAGSPE
ncbi:MFS transporter [Streptomyces sp. NPDC002734]|uniref:MFS transporter n=1 Tax=Streptomyces sp. NPDC002734 TaxID=3154426 RepID=UPI00332CF69F